MPVPLQIAPDGAPLTLAEMPAQLIAIVYDRVPVQPESVCVAWTENVYEPVTVGVPCNWPVVSSVKPVGSVPDVCENVNAPVRPVPLAVIV